MILLGGGVQDKVGKHVKSMNLITVSTGPARVIRPGRAATIKSANPWRRERKRGRAMSRAVLSSSSQRSVKRPSGKHIHKTHTTAGIPREEGMTPATQSQRPRRRPGRTAGCPQADHPRDVRRARRRGGTPCKTKITTFSSRFFSPHFFMAGQRKRPARTPTATASTAPCPAPRARQSADATGRCAVASPTPTSRAHSHRSSMVACTSVLSVRQLKSWLGVLRLRRLLAGTQSCA